MSLYSYFAEASKQSVLPNPNGSLSASVSPTAIKEANEAVKTRERASRKGVRLSSNLSSCCNQQVCLSTQAAIRHFSKQLDVIFSPSRGMSVSYSANHMAIEPAACTCTLADHAKFKTTKIYSQGILVNYIKICTNENFPLYGNWS